MDQSVVQKLLTGDVYNIKFQHHQAKGENVVKSSVLLLKSRSQLSYKASHEHQAMATLYNPPSQK